MPKCLTKRFPYQKEDIRRIVKEFKGRAILGHEMGLGKCIISVSAALRLHDNPIIIVCQAGLKNNWAKEIRRHFDMDVEVLSTMTPPRGRIVMEHRIIIVNYDILWPRKGAKGWLGYLRKLKPQMVIIDEGQKIKTRTSKRFRACKLLCSRARHVLILTGTAVLNMPAEIWPLCHLVRPDKYKSFFPFAQRFCCLERKPWGWEAKGARNLKVLHRKLKKHLFIRRLKKDCLKDLPKQTTHVRLLKISHRRQYDLAEKEFLKWIRKYHNRKLDAIKRALRLVKYGYMLRLVAKLKLEYMCKWIDKLFKRYKGKLVFFVINKKIVRRLFRRYKHRAVVIDGSKTIQERKEAERQFELDPKTDLLIANIEAGGTGHNLVSARKVAFGQFPWDPASLKQGAARIDRIGQKETTKCYHLVAANTIEHELLKLLERKQRVVDGVLDGKSPKDGMKIINQLEKKLLERRSR